VILRIPIGGFPISEETAQSLEALRGDRLLFRCSLDVQPGGLATAISHLSDRKTPELLIVELDCPHGEVFARLEGLAAVCDPETRLILISPHNDVELFQELIRNGVSDYIVSPVTPDKLRESISKTYEGLEADSDGRVISFMGLCGGVGSSIIAHNTAYELARIYDATSAIIDLDVCFGTAALNYNVQPRQTIVDALSQLGRLDGELLDQLFVPFEDKVNILASPASLNVGMGVTQESFDVLLKAVRPMADFVILDLPHFWSSWVSDALASADEVVLVGTPDLTSLREAKSMVEFIGPKRGVEAPTRLVLNKVGATKQELSEKDFKDAVAMKPAVSIPFEAETFGRALNNGEMLSKVSAKSKAAQAVANLATIVSKRAPEVEEKKSGFSLFKKSKEKDN
jgi:pilus assembly protein CpaE